MIEDNFLSARAKLAHESQHSNHPRISLQFWHRSSNVTDDLLKLIDCAGESWSLRLFIVARRRMLWALGQSNDLQFGTGPSDCPFQGSCCLQPKPPIQFQIVSAAIVNLGHSKQRDLVSRRFGFCGHLAASAREIPVTHSRSIHGPLPCPTYWNQTTKPRWARRVPAPDAN